MSHSAAGAAGYGDFMNQLGHNPYGLQFYTCLFPAVMQGAQTVPTVLAALDRINRHIDLFDCVVIIRGGGATSELNSFDNFELANEVAQFPIPVIVGIGHERDVTVLDYVAAVQTLLKGNVGDFKAIFRARRDFKKWKKDFAADREQIQAGRVATTMAEYASFMLLWQYFARGRKTFAQLQ